MSLFNNFCTIIYIDWPLNVNVGDGGKVAQRKVRFLTFFTFIEWKGSKGKSGTELERTTNQDFIQ